MVKLFLLTAILFTPCSFALTQECKELMLTISSADLYDETGSITNTYDCTTKTIVVDTSIDFSISPEVYNSYKDKFFDNYCFNMGKIYYSSTYLQQAWLKHTYSTIIYVIRHPLVPRTVYNISYDDCIAKIEPNLIDLSDDEFERIKQVQQLKYKASSQ
ncbi:hypothetical protein AVV30_gp044 [Vibrio phage phi 1]|uniref:Uncharacterized protein n=1 Tax=Vibrio phage phi 1 TaxID=1589297 RepID=A0A0B5H2L7_9CAUD|nr:hypothetical protein AVV30_gp044 [Vibrio phage phi 1]AJF40702.1 hypothetical protein SBVP1_0044 [Vibrio phage phi 1]